MFVSCDPSTSGSTPSPNSSTLSASVSFLVNLTFWFLLLSKTNATIDTAITDRTAIPAIVPAKSYQTLFNLPSAYICNFTQPTWHTNLICHSFRSTGAIERIKLGCVRTICGMDCLEELFKEDANYCKYAAYLIILKLPPELCSKLHWNLGNPWWKMP